jgi:putative nucleotidyltransferase with HDIG domain
LVKEVNERLADAEAEGSDTAEGAGDRPARVLIVDDDAAVREVLLAILRDEGYRAEVAASADDALEHVAPPNEEPDLVLSDLKMPGHDGVWLLEQLRKQVPDAAVVILTGYGDTESAVDCLRKGAMDYVLKPPRVTHLVRAIERALARRRIELARVRYQRRLEKRVKERTLELRQALSDVEAAYESTLDALASALDAREQETAHHSQRVVRVTVAIAERMGVRGRELDDIARGALLHDIGKIGVPDAILLKEGPLTPDEWVVMRKHPEIGAEILRSVPYLTSAADIVLCHQERWDGKGYPRGLRAAEIPLGARVFMVADTFDAITNDRPYRRGASWEAARQEIARNAGTQFDPQVVTAFLAMDDPTLEALRRESTESSAAH